MGGEVCYLEGAPAPCLTGPVLEDARESAGRPFFVAALLLLTAFVAHLAVSRAQHLGREVQQVIHAVYDMGISALSSMLQFVGRTEAGEQLQALRVPTNGATLKLHDVLFRSPQGSSNFDMDSEDVLRAMNILSNSGIASKCRTLVLDLDETLVHAAHDNEERAMEADFRVFDDETHQYFKVWKRPHVDVFLEHTSQLYDIVIYTASFACYADPIIDALDRRCVVKKRLYNTSVVLTSEGAYEKDLSLANSAHFPKQLVMIDNSPGVCRTHRENLCVIESFRAESPTDDALLKLIPFLEALTATEDFRCVLHRKKYLAIEPVPSLLARGEPVHVMEADIVQKHSGESASR